MRAATAMTCGVWCLLLWAGLPTRAVGEDIRVLRRSWSRTPRPAVPVPIVPEAPKVDGDLDEPVWQRASSVGGFVLARDGPGRRALRDAPPVATRLLVARDHSMLYLAVRCAEPSADLIRSVPRARDQFLGPDDSIEIYLTDSDHTPRFVHISVNPDGSVRDARGHFGRTDEDTDYDTAGRVRARRGATEWTVEAAIPLAELQLNDGGVPANPGQPTAIWAAVVRRRWAGAGPGASLPELLSWTGSAGPERLGRLVLAPLAVQVPELPNSKLAVGSAESVWRITSGAGGPARLTAGMLITGQLAESSTFEGVTELPTGRAIALTHRWSAHTEGYGWLSLVLTEPVQAGRLHPFRVDTESTILACIQRPVSVPVIAMAVEQLGRRILSSGLDPAEQADLEKTWRRLSDQTEQQIRVCAGRAFGPENDQAWSGFAAEVRTTLTELYRRLDAQAEQATLRQLERGTPPLACQPNEPLIALVERWVHATGAVLEDGPVRPQAGSAGIRSQAGTVREQLDELARAADLRLESAEIGERLRLLPSRVGESRPPIYRGPFRLQPMSLSVGRPLGLVPAGRGPTGPDALLRLSLEWEPGLWVTAISAEPEVLSLAEETGQPLRSADGQEGMGSLVAQPNGLRRDWRVAIPTPPAGTGRLRSLRLGVTVVLAVAREHVEWSSQQLCQPVASACIWLGEVFVRSSAINRVADRHTVMLEIDGEQAEETPLESRITWPALPEVRVVWLDRQGRPLPVVLERERLDRRTLMLSVSVPSSGDGREPELGRLRIECPRRLHQHRLILTVGDLVLP